MTLIDMILDEIDDAKACLMLARRKIKGSEYSTVYEYIDESRQAINKILELFP